MKCGKVRRVTSLVLAVAGCGHRAEETAPRSGLGLGAVAALTQPVAKPATTPVDAWNWTPEPPGPPRVLVTVVYGDGYVSGLADDRDVKVGDGFLRLSQLRRWRRAGTGEILPR